MIAAVLMNVIFSDIANQFRFGAVTAFTVIVGFTVFLTAGQDRFVAGILMSVIFIGKLTIQVSPAIAILRVVMRFSGQIANQGICTTAFTVNVVFFCGTQKLCTRFIATLSVGVTFIFLLGAGQVTFLKCRAAVTVFMQHRCRCFYRCVASLTVKMCSALRKGTY